MTLRVYSFQGTQPSATVPGGCLLQQPVHIGSDPFGYAGKELLAELARIFGDQVGRLARWPKPRFGG